MSFREISNLSISQVDVMHQAASDRIEQIGEIISDFSNKQMPHNSILDAAIDADIAALRQVEKAMRVQEFKGLRD